jgi:hypothetical protein
VLARLQEGGVTTMDPWAAAFFIGVYVSLAICVYACIRIGLATGFTKFLINLGLLLLFAVAHWLLESWANTVAPFYSYPQNVFPDMIPHFDWGAFGFGPPDDCCNQAPSPKISATIPLSGSIITFCLLWTARLLLTTTRWMQPYRPVIAPFMVGLVALVLDGFLDPVLAISNSCGCVGVSEVLHPGLGFWQWFTRPEFADYWFDIPLFNFANWYAFPAAMAALVLWLGWARMAISGGPVSFVDGLLRTVILLSLAAVLITAPGKEPPTVQISFIVMLITISVYIIVRDWGSYKRDNPFRWEFVVPMLFYFLYPIVALIGAGVFPISTATLVLALVALALMSVGLWYVFSPYSAP